MKIKLNTILGPLTLIILVGVYFFTSKEGPEEKRPLPKAPSVKEAKISQRPAERNSQEAPLEKEPQKKTEGEKENVAEVATCSVQSTSFLRALNRKRLTQKK